MNIKRAIVGIALLGAAGLVGCGGSSSSDLDDAGGVSVHSFSATGTDGVKSAGSTTINIAPTQNGGMFKLEHDASASGTSVYRIDWYISTDATKSDDDKQFFGRNCDIGTGDCAGESAAFNCQFTSDVKTICQAGVSGGNDTTSLSTYFSAHAGLPGNYFLLFVACDGFLDNCETHAIPATFQ